MPLDDTVRDIELKDALGERYLAYALSTIMGRALPDVRDGLKPVHRRLLWAMQRLRLDPASAPKKCARIVGDVIGQFHPHGDQSVYDALVRLAQDFSLRYPLIEGQGNFGNIDGDNPAAYRYTESRLTEVAIALLDGLEDDGTDFRPTYDGQEREPSIMPGLFPNLLANGSAGIAVGMATNIPPHNLDEIAQALIHLLAKPEAREETLLNYIKGPDFPTGGVIVEPPDAIAEAYRTGKGGFRLRARWHREEGARGSWHVVVTEIPYQVVKSKLIEKLAELAAEKKLTLVADARDESAEDVRIVIEPKSRTVDPELMMEQVFRLTDLEIRFPMNLTVLDARQTPHVMSLKQTLIAFVDHAREVLLRRTRFRLQKIADRLELLEGYLAVYLNIDEVIRIIREEDEPKTELMARFSLTDNQAEAILNMRLRSLRKLEEIEIKKEHKALSAERRDLNALVKSPELQNDKLKDSFQGLRQKFGAKTKLGKRRTDIATAPVIEDMPEDVFIEKEPVTVICSEKGWIRAMKGHVVADDDVKFKEGDRGRFTLRCQTTDKLVLFATNGRFFTLSCNELPGGRGHGEPVRLMIDLDNDQDIVALFVHQPGRRLLLASSGGYGFVVPEEEVLAQKKAGKQILNLAEGDEAKVCSVAEGDTVSVVGDNRKLLLFPLAELPEMARGKGLTLMKFKDGGLLDVASFMFSDGLIDFNGRQWTKSDLNEYRGDRAQAGRLVPKSWPKNGRFQPKL
ncbi:MAG TPA: DNA topoisomerase IV subunit A [Alphaproteobacteria bacterium]|nr:DNA topoisomerase IV subunit A [Alphaproteobacteria bacterium]HAJ47431.1 DNA topoisomerase IV subunit A [Alphaproteobacteria bacterium]